MPHLDYWCPACGILFLLSDFQHLDMKNGVLIHGSAGSQAHSVMPHMRVAAKELDCIAQPKHLLPDSERRQHYTADVYMSTPH